MNYRLLKSTSFGGGGLAAIDIGAKIYGTARSGKHAFLKQRGLDEAIDCRG